MNRETRKATTTKLAVKTTTEAATTTDGWTTNALTVVECDPENFGENVACYTQVAQPRGPPLPPYHLTSFLID